MRSPAVTMFSNFKHAPVPWAKNIRLMPKLCVRKIVKIELVSRQYTSVIRLVLFGVSRRGDNENIDIVALSVTAEAIFHISEASGVEHAQSAVMNRPGDLASVLCWRVFSQFNFNLLSPVVQ